MLCEFFAILESIDINSSELKSYFSTKRFTINTSLTKTNLLNIPLLKKAKVRDIYDLGDYLLIIATDRISAFDCVLPNGIPNKGKILTQLSLFWFDQLASILPNHVITANIDDYPSTLQKFKEQLRECSMIVKRAKVFPIECVVRGYLAGSGWKDYLKTNSICGIKLPLGLSEFCKLDDPIFTPATKVESGHDENISEIQMASIIGQEATSKLKQLSLSLYQRATQIAGEKGIIISDTKFEFGMVDGEITWIDEALTPDSSRFWSYENYRIGQTPEVFDKQYVRNYLETLDWNKMAPAPKLPEEIILNTQHRYLEIYTKLTGKTIEQK